MLGQWADLSRFIQRVAYPGGAHPLDEQFLENIDDPGQPFRLQLRARRRM